MERVQKAAIIKDLKKKMVFLAGPRQAGKTTLSKEISKEFSSSVYLNYDLLEDKKIIESKMWLPETELLIFDEIHKMPLWKTFLKGIYDTKPENQKIIVTGSARLEIFRRAGDSLAGRYFLHRLFPLSLAECKQLDEKSTLNRFLERGGFPEPFLADSPVYAHRWRLQYSDSLIRTDVLDFDNLHNVKSIHLVYELLRNRVGSPISYSSIAEDVGIAPNTVKKYIEILEALYVIFRVFPHSKNIARSLLKEPKIYFFDNGLVQGDDGVKLENFIAFSLLKHVHGKIDYEAKEYSLKYLRTKERKEVDFALINNNTVESIIEVKNTNNTISPNLLYFHEKYDLPAYQVVKNLKQERMEKKIKIVRAENFLSNLYL